jgi:guanylate kinase|tara:strand:+ start:226 stop:822 length:597 start_codon:yes stop_codon:yes gene_type:complete
MKDVSSCGIILLVSGPAGIGKTTVCESLLAEFSPGLARAVTATTRAPREGEQDGLDYHFLSTEEFDQKVLANEFYEHALVHGRRYGTLKSEIRKRLEMGADLLLNVDVQGFEAFRKASETDSYLAGKLLTVFLMPPDLKELRLRLSKRGTDSEEEIDRRMATARAEVARNGEYDYCVNSKSMGYDLSCIRKIYLDAKV